MTTKTNTRGDQDIRTLERVAGLLLAAAVAVASLTSCQPAKAEPPAATERAR